MSQKCIALLGIGHTNAHVVRQWATNPIPNCRLVCISKFPYSTYSGMLPGTLAGQFLPEEMQIDLRRLAGQAGAELILDEVTRLGAETRTLHFANRPPLRFDVLSVGVGSVPAQPTDCDQTVVSIKPMQTFLQRLDECATVGRNENAKFAVVGGGVAGIEIALCLQARLAGHVQPDSISLFTAAPEIGDGLSQRSVRRLRRVLRERGIDIRTRQRVTAVKDGAIVTAEGMRQRTDGVIWATGAVAPPVLSKLGLPTDERGFLLTGRTLKTTADLPIFAVGDCGTIESAPSPKAGVYAVRQAPVLWNNLRSQVTGGVLGEFRPQGNFLKILNTGDRKALMEFAGISWHSRWCMALKTWIDKRFITPYQLEPSSV